MQKMTPDLHNIHAVYAFIKLRHLSILAKGVCDTEFPIHNLLPFIHVVNGPPYKEAVRILDLMYVYSCVCVCLVWWWWWWWGVIWRIQNALYCDLFLFKRSLNNEQCVLLYVICGHKVLLADVIWILRSIVFVRETFVDCGTKRHHW